MKATGSSVRAAEPALRCYCLLGDRDKAPRVTQASSTTTSAITSLGSRSRKPLAGFSSTKSSGRQSHPNEQGDWINQRSDHYLGLRPVAAIQSEDSIPSLPPVFESSSLGVITSRDAWVFNSSGRKLRELIERQVTFYNGQVAALQNGANTVVRDSLKFKWDGTASKSKEQEEES